jgi:hypothetical protein
MRRTILLAKARVDGSPEIAITGRHGHATYKIDRMSQDYVTAGRVITTKSACSRALMTFLPVRTGRRPLIPSQGQP